MASIVHWARSSRARARHIRRLLMLMSVVMPLAVGAAVAPTPARAESAAAPEAVVNRFDSTLLQVMRDADHFGYQARYDTLAAVMGETFDFEGMARVAVGAMWSSLSPDQKTAIVNAFREFSIATYAAEFTCYAGERFVTDGRRESPEGVMVTATLLPKDDKPVKFGYLLHNVGGTWRIIDIYLDGTISQLAVRRSEFSSVLAQNSPNGLVYRLMQKTQKLTQAENPVHDQGRCDPAAHSPAD